MCVEVIGTVTGCGQKKRYSGFNGGSVEKFAEEKRNQLRQQGLLNADEIVKVHKRIGWYDDAWVEKEED